MSKYLADAALDAALDHIATSTRLDITSDSSTPANLTNSLGNITLTAGAGNGDYTKADGDTSGRKLTVAAQTGISVTASGDSRHLVLSVGGAIKAVTTCVQQTLTSGNTANTPAWDIELPDPS